MTITTVYDTFADLEQVLGMGMEEGIRTAVGQIGALLAAMDISLPEPLKAFVDEQVARGAYGSTSEYVRDLIRRDHERSRLRDVLLAGAESSVNVDVDDAFFAELRDRARQPADG